MCCFSGWFGVFGGEGIVVLFLGVFFGDGGFWLVFLSTDWFQGPPGSLIITYKTTVFRNTVLTPGSINSII